MINYERFSSPYPADGEPECFVGEVKRGLSIRLDEPVSIPVMRPVPVAGRDLPTKNDILSISEITGSPARSLEPKNANKQTRSYFIDARNREAP